MSNALHNLLASRGILGDKDADECMTWAAGEIENLKSERDGLLEFARRIGKLIGCGHTENPDDRDRLVSCVRDAVKETNKLKMMDAESERLCKELCFKLGNALHRAEVAEAIVRQLPTTADGAPIIQKV